MLGTSGTILFQGGTLQFTANNTTDYSSRFSSSSTNYSINLNGQTVVFASVPDGGKPHRIGHGHRRPSPDRHKYLFRRHNQ